MRQRLTNKLQLNLNYTWSLTRSNYDGDNTLSSVNDASQTAQDFFDIDSAWGPVIGDVAHSFIGSVIYGTLGIDWSSPLARHLIGGWQISGIFRARTGEPLIVTQASSKAGSRPDVIDVGNAINENWINYVAAQTNITASNFGKITGTAAARVAQVQARFSF